MIASPFGSTLTPSPCDGIVEKGMAGDAIGPGNVPDKPQGILSLYARNRMSGTIIFIIFSNAHVQQAVLTLHHTVL